jgi:hypothetical protein
MDSSLDGCHSKLRVVDSSSGTASFVFHGGEQPARPIRLPELALHFSLSMRSLAVSAVAQLSWVNLSTVMTFGYP